MTQPVPKTIASKGIPIQPLSLPSGTQIAGAIALLAISGKRQPFGCTIMGLRHDALALTLPSSISCALQQGGTYFRCEVYPCPCSSACWFPDALNCPRVVAEKRWTLPASSGFPKGATRPSAFTDATPV